MIVYEATKSEFLSDVFEDQLVPNICNNYNTKIGKINESEVRSWDNSMQYMYRVLMDNEIPSDAGVAIEFKIPHTSRRVDFLISGKEDTTNSVVVVELKQWESIKKVDNKEAVVETLINRGIRETTHPSYQAWSYAALIKDYNENVQNENIEIYPCAYLHNYITPGVNDPLTDEVYQYYIDQAPIFIKGNAGKLRDFIKRYIKFGDNKETLYKIESGRIRPSKSLQDSLNNMLKGNQEFIMIDDQKVVYETALQLAKDAVRSNKKHVLVVQGGPGTGKSVLAINLLVEMTNRSLVSQYVTKNAAPRKIYANKLKQDYRKGHIDNLFKGSGSYVNAPENEFDVLIVDEAHRLNEKSGMFQNLGENQIKEIISASKLSIFFIDERQRVTLKDVGSIGMIEKFAMEHGAPVTRMNLESQFRCNGSDGYLAWIDDVLQIRETANANHIANNYDFRIYSDPNELRCEIEKLNRVKNKSRLVAGYCWDWIKEGKSKSNYHDIVLPEHGFGMSWNLDSSETWAIDPESVNEVGCIHTCQGLEFDYVGVIIGDDLIYRDQEIKTDYNQRAKTDSSLKGIKKMMKENPEEAKRLADEIIRNTYRTLMTRGQKGCFVYCTDKELERYLEKRFTETQFEYKENEFFKPVTSVAENNREY
ncbi:DNA/RNA helicase domain-containing protein [Pseudalkalibacillus sp. R45]|uniref:DNA/RNA helicase domain-containing protein n=1 Tax=Pseudalkalibacillus sp. R45 TaxID=3457433 RepID=UPI003FCDEB6D